MMSYIWPIALVVVSNILYQIRTKSVPREMDSMASMTVTYLVGALLYQEAVTPSKVLGAVICLAGLYFLGK